MNVATTAVAVIVLAASVGCGSRLPAGSGAGGRAGEGVSGASGAVAGGRGGGGGSAGTDGNAGAGGSSQAAGGRGGGDAGSGRGGDAAGGRGGDAGGGRGGGSAGGPGGPVDVTAALDGQEYLMPCTGRDNAFTFLRCDNYGNSIDGCLSGGTSLTSGLVMRDDTLTVGGPPGVVFDVTLRIRGVVEPKHYVKGAPGSPSNGTNYGWYVGGEPATPASYDVYMLWVSAPVVTQTGTLDGQYYFLNAIDHPELHFSYPIDYTVTLPVAAGAQIRFLADDPNCSMVKNCGSTSIDAATSSAARCDPITIADLPATSGIAQPYPGQFIYLTVVSATLE